MFGGSRMSARSLKRQMKPIIALNNMSMVSAFVTECIAEVNTLLQAFDG